MLRGAPRVWFMPNEVIRATQVPSSFGRLGFVVQTFEHVIKVNITVPLQWGEKGARVPNDGLILRLRIPNAQKIKSVLVANTSWSLFDIDAETVSFPTKWLVQNAKSDALQNVLIKYF